MRTKHAWRFLLFLAALICGVAGVANVWSAEKTSNGEKKVDSATEQQRQEEYNRLLLQQDKMVKGGRASNLKFNIADINLSIPVPKVAQKFPIPQLEIRGGCFYCDGKPAYMLGGEAQMSIHAFLYKLLGLRWVQDEGPFYIGNTLQMDQDGDQVNVTWRYPKEIDLAVKELLENGLLVYAQPIELDPTTTMKNYEALTNSPDLLVTMGHFYAFRHDQPEAWKIQKNFFKSILSATAKYPVSAYELFNEVTFIDYNNGALTRFRAAMEKKYGTIQQANQVWQTDFNDFDHVQPPLSGNGWDSSFTVLGKNVSRMLWLDWRKFSEKNSAAAFQKVSDVVYRYDPSAYRTIQTHCLFDYDYAASGINPALKSKAENFYGDESPFQFHIAFPGNDQIDCVPAVGLLWLDYLTQIVPDKPQVSEETPVANDYLNLSSIPHVVDMNNSRWKFKSDNAAQGEKLGYENPDFDDSGWKNIKVPDMWANQGYADTSIGWYRYAFTLPAGFQKEKLYLNGWELADDAVVYVNGTEVHHTATYDERFAAPVSSFLKTGRNVIAVRIKNLYFAADRYWGGIRKWMSLDTVAAAQTIPLSYGQLRSCLWERTLHGEAGVFLSYMYGPEGDRSWSFFNPTRMAYSALKALPQARAELESVGPIVLAQKPRIQGRVALVYPLEEMRYHIPKDAMTMRKGPLIHDLSHWYVGLICSGVPASVIPNSDLLDPQDISRYQAIFMQGNDRVPDHTVAALRDYVTKGGILVLDSSSLTREDDFNRSLDTVDLLGCRRLTIVTKDDQVDLSHFGLGTLPLDARQRDGSRGCDLQVTSAQVLARDEQGNPAIVVNKVGKGKVYTLGCEFSPDVTVKLLQAILVANHITPDVELQTDGPMPYAEKYLLGTDGRYVLYVQNWGGGTGPVTVRLLKDISPGTYRVRNLETRRTMAPDISSVDLETKGLPVELASQTPMALLLEKTSLTPWPIQGLTQQQEFWLNYVDQPAPEHVAKNKRILMDASHAEEYSRIDLLTAVKALQDQGYEVNISIGDWTKDVIQTYSDHLQYEKLNHYGIIFMGGMTCDFISPSEIEKIVNWTREGGSLFVCGNWFRGPYGWLSNYNFSRNFYSQFGATVENEGFEDSKECLDGEAVYPIFTNIASTDQTKGVSRLYSQGMAVLSLNDPAWQPLVRGNVSSNHPDQPAIAIRTFGKGKVVLCGDAAWLKPSLLEHAENRRLFLNLIQWLNEKSAPTQ